MSRSSLVGPVVKSLVFILVTTLATAVLAISVANTGVGESTTYKAWFTDTTGLIEGDSVRVAGVKVGQVESISVVAHRYAEVEFSVEKDRELPASTTAAIKYFNMAGQRYLALGQGTGPVGEPLSAREPIPLERTSPSLDLTQLFNGFQPLMQGLSPKETNRLAASIIQVLQGEGATVDDLMETIGSLTTTLAEKDEVIGDIIDNLNTVLKTVDDREEEFTDLVGTLEELVRGFSGDREPIGQAIGAMSELTTSTAGLLEDGRPALKDDIRELRRVSGNLAADAPLVENLLDKAPAKAEAVSRIASYGSWLNFYLCEAKLTGVTTYDGSPPPTGIGITDSRCRR